MRTIILVVGLLACGGENPAPVGGSGGGGSQQQPSGPFTYLCSVRLVCTGVETRTANTIECANSGSEAEDAAERGGTCSKSASCSKTNSRC